MQSFEPKFYYIIEMDGQIHEMPYTKEKFSNAIEQHVRGGTLVSSDGKSIKMTGVRKVLLEGDDYENFIDTARPRSYIKNGTVYETKTGHRIRVLKWRQQEMDRIDKLPKPKKQEKIASPEVIKKIKNQIQEKLKNRYDKN